MRANPLFEVVKHGVWGDDVRCPVCKKTFMASAIRGHIANAGRHENYKRLDGKRTDAPHHDWYLANTYEKQITVREWKV